MCRLCSYSYEVTARNATTTPTRQSGRRNGIRTHNLSFEGSDDSIFKHTPKVVGRSRFELDLNAYNNPAQNNIHWEDF